MWWGTPQHVQKGRASAAAEAAKMAASVPSLSSTPMDLDVRTNQKSQANMLHAGLQSLLSNKECCDIVFVASDEQIEAHAVVLAASSTNFRKYLTQSSKCEESTGGGMEDLFTMVSTNPAVPAEEVKTENDPPAAETTGEAAAVGAETEATEPSDVKKEPSEANASAEAPEVPAQAPMDVDTPKPEEGAEPAAAPPSVTDSKVDKIRVQVNGLSSSEAMHILLDYVYGGSSANWDYQATSAQVNKDVLRLATHFGFAILHEHAARWLVKGLTTENVVDRLVTCEEFGLGLLREKITERLALKPAELMLVCSSPEITKHPRILQDLLVKVASLKDKPIPKNVPEVVEEKEEEKPAKPEKEKVEKPEKPDKKHEKAEKAEKPSKQAEKQTGKKRKAGA